MDYAPLLDPELAAFLPGMPDPDLVNYVEWRAACALPPQQAYLTEPQIDASGVRVADRNIPGLPGDPDVRVRTYEPIVNPSGSALVYFHGGGFVLGEVGLFDSFCKGFATEAGAVVVSVDYRLAPEHPFPAAVHDAYAALEWTAAHGAELGVDPSAIAVGGVSAGGALAAVVSLMARDRHGPPIALQLLINAVLDDRLETASACAFTDSPLWNRGHAAVMWDMYLGPDRNEVSAYAAPARADDLTGLPAAYVLTSEFDPLRDEGIAYAARMIEAGVSVELHNFPGTFHGFDAFPSTISRQATAEQHAALRSMKQRSNR